MTFYDYADDFSNPLKGSSTKAGGPGFYLGKVVRVTGGIFVTIPAVAAGSTFGPCKTFCAHPILGQTVLCGFLDNKFNEVVILGKESTSKVIKDVDTPTANTDASNKLYVDNQISTLLAYVNAQLALKANL
jgi:hypothetical protein